MTEFAARLQDRLRRDLASWGKVRAAEAVLAGCIGRLTERAADRCPRSRAPFEDRATERAVELRGSSRFRDRLRREAGAKKKT